MKSVSNNMKISQGAATTGAGTSEIDGATIDMQGYEGIIWIAKFGTAATDNTLQAQQGNDSSLTDAQDLEDTKVTVGSSDEIVWLELVKPIDRYVRTQVQRGTSTTLDWCVALQYGAHEMPVDNTVAGTIAGELHISPDEGTV